MNISREKADHLLSHDYKCHVYADGKVTKIVNTELPPSMWKWEVKLSNSSIDRHRIKIFLQKRPYRLCIQTFRNSAPPKIGDRVILRSGKSAGTSFSPYKATVYAIISRN